MCPVSPNLKPDPEQEDFASSKPHCGVPKTMRSEMSIAELHHSDTPHLLYSLDLSITSFSFTNLIEGLHTLISVVQDNPWFVGSERFD